MKLSEAITELKLIVHAQNHPRSLDQLNALNLAIACLTWRIRLKDGWAFSSYKRLHEEDDE